MGSVILHESHSVVVTVLRWREGPVACVFPIQMLCQPFGGIAPYTTRMVVGVATANGVPALEMLYHEDGDRLWRALLAFGGWPRSRQRPAGVGLKGRFSDRGSSKRAFR